MTAPTAWPLTPQRLAWASAQVLLPWLVALWLHLVPALFAALVTYAGARALARSLRKRWPGLRHAEGLALAVILLLLSLLVAGGTELVVQARAQGIGLEALLQHGADVLEKLRAKLPEAVGQHLPESVDALREMARDYLREHTDELKAAGGRAAKLLGHVIVGIVIGAMLVFQLPALAPADGAALETKGDQPPSWPLATAARQRFEDLVGSFSAVVFAQVQISAINTVLTAVMLLGLLPLLGHPLPFAGTLVAVTFAAGLVPVVGNLVSNAIIFVAALSQGLGIALLAIGWLMVIHKLEYFLNAHIIGSRIKAKAFELLLVMVVLESTFGLAGLISAPVIYAQWKQAMQRRGWLQ